MTTKTVVKIKAFNGISSFGLTFMKNFEAGSPPSRAKAYVMRELVVMMEIVAKRRHTRGKLDDCQSENGECEIHLHQQAD